MKEIKRGFQGAKLWAKEFIGRKQPSQSDPEPIVEELSFGQEAEKLHTQEEHPDIPSPHSPDAEKNSETGDQEKIEEVRDELRSEVQPRNTDTIPLDDVLRKASANLSDNKGKLRVFAQNAKHLAAPAASVVAFLYGTELLNEALTNAGGNINQILTNGDIANPGVFFALGIASAAITVADAVYRIRKKRWLY